MPREIITLQVGQCGNQSKHCARLHCTSRYHVVTSAVLCAVVLRRGQSGLSSGSSCAQSTASSRTARCWTSRATTGRTCSSTRCVCAALGGDGQGWWDFRNGERKGGFGVVVGG